MFIFDENSRKTLKIVSLIWLIFLLGCGLGGWLLARRVGAVESQVHPVYAQPLFAESEEQVAYLSKLPDGDHWELWVVPLVNPEPKKLLDLDKGEWDLKGWFNDDKQLLLVPRQQGAPRILTVDAQSGAQKEIRFENEGVNLVGVRGGQLFFERRSGQEGSRSLTLLSWSPGDQKLNQIAHIPFDTETMRVESVWPSLDKHWLALVILLGDENPDRSLWLYNREDERLSWTGVRLQSQAIRGAWSPDSQGLVAAVETEKSCDIYAFWDVRDGKYTRLSSGEQHRAYQPFWPRGTKEFLLVEGQQAYKFDPETLRAEVLRAPEWDTRKSRDLVISPRGNYAAYIGPEDEHQQLYRVGLAASQRQSLLPASEQVQSSNEWWYVLGKAARNVVSGWASL